MAYGDDKVHFIKRKIPCRCPATEEVQLGQHLLVKDHLRGVRRIFRLKSMALHGQVQEGHMAVQPQIRQGGNDNPFQGRHGDRNQ